MTKTLSFYYSIFVNFFRKKYGVTLSLYISEKTLKNSCQFRYALEKNLKTIEIIRVNTSETEILVKDVQVKMHEKSKQMRKISIQKSSGFMRKNTA